MCRNGCRSAVTSANNSLAAALSAAGRERRSAAPPVSVCGLPLAVVKVPTRASNRKRKPLFRTGSICFSVQFSSIIRSLPAPISPPALRPAPRRSRSNTSAKLRTPPGPGALPGARRDDALDGRCCSDGAVTTRVSVGAGRCCIASKPVDEPGNETRKLSYERSSQTLVTTLVSYQADFFFAVYKARSNPKLPRFKSLLKARVTLTEIHDCRLSTVHATLLVRLRPYRQASPNSPTPSMEA